jgi:hypothetical protein
MQHDFTHISGIGPALNKILRERFSSWQEIHDVDWGELQDIKGMTKGAAQELRRLAKTQMAIVKVEATKGEERLVGIEKGDEYGDEGSDADDETYVLIEIPIDEKTILRRRKLLTPAICVECGLDFITKRGLKPWKELRDSTKESILELMEQHKALKHNVGSQKLMTKKQIQEMNQDQTGLYPEQAGA